MTPISTGYYCVITYTLTHPDVEAQERFADLVARKIQGERRTTGNRVTVGTSMLRDLQLSFELPMMGLCGKHYLILIGLWGGLNFVYLVWFFIRGLHREAMHSFLKKS